MPTTSASSPSSSTSAVAAGKQRTRNAQAQADLRARRKNYIKTLEDTVSSLEACVRQLRAQQAETTQKGGDVDEEVRELRAENARLYAMLAEAGLVDVTNEAESSTCSTARKAKASAAKTWSSTCSITTKKRKLSKMQAFAQQVDSQLSGQISANSSTSPSHSHHEPQQQQQQRAYPSFSEQNVSYLPDPASGLDVAVGGTPSTASSSASSSSRSSRGDSVVSSQRSPKTHRFESNGLQHDEKPALGLAFEAPTATAWYDTPVVLAPVSNAAMAAQYVQASPLMSLPPTQADASTWMIPSTSSAAATTATSNIWPLSFQACDYSPSMFDAWLPDAAQQRGRGV